MCLMREYNILSLFWLLLKWNFFCRPFPDHLQLLFRASHSPLGAGQEREQEGRQQLHGLLALCSCPARPAGSHDSHEL